METLITISVIGTLAAIGMVTTSNVVSKSREQKLISDVATLNRSIIAFVGSGGDLSKAENPDEVLLALKKSFSNASRMPGFSGSKLDERVAFTYQNDKESQSKNSRAYWNSAEGRFVISTSGDTGGISGVTLVDTPPSNDGTEIGTTGTSNAKVPLLYAEETSWIWDYEEVAPSVAPGPSTVSVSEVADTTPTPSGSATGLPTASVIPLDPPTFSVPGGSFPISSFNLPLTLMNPNPSGSSEIYYSVDFGNWLRYSSPIAVAPGSIIATQAIALTDLYASSSKVDESYSVIPIDLLPPIITPSSPEFGLFTNRALTVSLADQNSSAISKLEYRIGGDPWQTYTASFTLDRNSYPSGAMIQARAVPQSQYYIASNATLRTLGIEKALISGTSAGSFSKPIGEAAMLTNLTGGSSGDYFTWGRDYLIGNEKVSPEVLLMLKQSSLEYSTVSFSGMEENQRFQIGNLSYLNGTTISGTAANQVSFSTDLSLNLNGVYVKSSFNFNFDLVNVLNTNNPNDPWADADFVKLARPVASEVLDFNGVQYKLQLEFGDATSSGIALFDEFHVLEGKTATTKVYGTLIEIGTVGFND